MLPPIREAAALSVIWNKIRWFDVFVFFKRESLVDADRAASRLFALDDSVNERVDGAGNNGAAKRVIPNTETRKSNQIFIILS